MNAHRFNGSVRAARINAEQAYLGDLEGMYLRLIRQAGREAATNLKASVVTAAAVPSEGAAPGWQVPPEGILFAVAQLATTAAVKVGRLHRRILDQVAGRPLARIGIAWDITHPLSQALLDASGRRTGERLGEAVQPVLRAVVAEAYAQGLSVVDAADLIREKIAEAAPAQAEMLARTDLNGLSNGGSVMAATLAGVAFKQWQTGEDDKVRAAHMEADGQTVPVGQPFDVCGEQLGYPGDPAGSDACTANCRCTVVYADAADAAPAALAASGRSPLRLPSRSNALVIVQNIYGFRAGGAMSKPQKSTTAAVTVTVDDTPDQQEATPVAWVSDIAFEGVATDDGRYILPDALTWRDPPLTLMAMTETSDEGHNGAYVAGRMDTFEKSPVNMDGDQLASGVVAVRARGVFDTEGENGAGVARLVGDETVRGVSVDLAIDDWLFRDSETGELIEPVEATDQEMEKAMFGELQFAVRGATILAATVCPTPAFANARISVTASGERVLTLWAPLRLTHKPVTASAAGLAPAVPPAEWFALPEPDQPTPLTVTDDGHVYGHIAAWNSCHTGKQGVCFTPPRSPSGYAYFNTGEIRCADGKRVAVGQVTFETDHASLSATARGAKAHYEHTGVAAADVRAVDGAHGIWVAGALRPHLTVEQARALMGARPSGDWRQITPGGPLEMIGVLAVNVPGFSVPRQVVASAEDADDGEVVALTARFDMPDDPAVDRKLRVLAARAEGGVDALAALAEA